MDIEGYLEAKVEMTKVSVPVDIEGSFEIKYEDNLETSKNGTSIKVCIFSINDQLNLSMSQVYSDFILDKQPTTVNETLQIFKDISKNFGNIENHYQYSSPMYAQLIPIKMVSISLLLCI